MKKILTLYFALLTISAFCQNHDNTTSNKNDSVFNYNDVEDKPEFPGGQGKMMEFVSKNLKYPEKAKANNITGEVQVQFVVGKTGYIENVKVMKSAYPLLDSEAVRVIKLMPRWEPGKLKGENVKVLFHFPLSFKLR